MFEYVHKVKLMSTNNIKKNACYAQIGEIMQASSVKYAVFKAVFQSKVTTFSHTSEITFYPKHMKLVGILIFTS